MAKKSIHTKKWERCVKSVEKDGKDTSTAAAICSSSIKDGGVKKKHQRKSGLGYYANRKKVEKNEGIITKFDKFINEGYFEDDIDSECEICGSEQTWCESCDMYSCHTCDEYGTCACN